MTAKWLLLSQKLSLGEIMKTMQKELTLECIDVLARYAGVSLTVPQFNELMKENPELNDQLVEYNSPNDTMDREDLMDSLSKQVLGKSWPMYKDGDEYFYKFYQEFHDQCLQRGYKLTEG